MHGQRDLAQTALDLRIDGRGADLQRRARLILVHVIVEALLRDDLDGGQRLPVQHAHIDLTAPDVLLHHHALQAQVGLQRVGKLRLGIGDGHADGGTAVHGLDDHRQLRLRDDAGDLLLSVCMGLPCRGAHAQRRNNLLGQILVHGQRAAQTAAAGVGHAQQIQRRLDAAVLAARAVQAQEHHVRHLAQLQHALADLAGTDPPAGGLHLFKVRGLGANLRLLNLRQLVEDALDGRLHVLQTKEHIHQHRPVAQRAKRLADQRAAGDGDVALHAQAAAQHHNFHMRFRLSRSATSGARPGRSECRSQFQSMLIGKSSFDYNTFSYPFPLCLR